MTLPLPLYENGRRCWYGMMIYHDYYSIASGLLEFLCFWHRSPIYLYICPEAKRSLRLQKEEKISKPELLFTWRCHWHANGRAASRTKIRCFWTARIRPGSQGQNHNIDLGERVIRLFENIWKQNEYYWCLALKHLYFFGNRSIPER